MPQLDLNPDIVRSVIDIVHEFHAGDDVNLRGDDEEAAVDEDLLMQAQSEAMRQQFEQMRQQQDEWMPAAPYGWNNPWYYQGY